MTRALQLMCLAFTICQHPAIAAVAAQQQLLELAQRVCTDPQPEAVEFSGVFAQRSAIEFRNSSIGERLDLAAASRQGAD